MVYTYNLIIQEAEVCHRKFMANLNYIVSLKLA